MKDRFQHFNSGRANFFMVAIIVLILFGAVLKITSSVVLPFTLALLLAVVTSPLVLILAKFHIPRGIAVFLIVFLLVGILASVGMVLYSSSRVLFTLYPKYQARLTEIYIMVARLFELPYDEHFSLFDNLWGQISVRSQVRLITISVSNALLRFLGNAFMVVLFMIFLLFEAAFLGEKLDSAFEGERAEKIRKITSDVMRQITRYLSIKFIISVINGLVIGIGFKIIGLEFAVVWGVIQFVMNFIPNIGSIAFGLAATAFSVVQFWPDPTPIIAVGLVTLGTNLILGSFIDPHVMGDRLGLSPLVVLVSLLIWGFIWGFVGLILAVPMMAIIKIVCENFPILEPISILLGSRKAALATRNRDDRDTRSDEIKGGC